VNDRLSEYRLAREAVGMMRKLLILVTGLLLVAPCGNLLRASQDAKRSPPFPSATANPPDPEYKIGPQDVLRVDVWKEPEISRVAPVRPDGRISLPLLNDVHAAGLTPAQLANVIAEGLKKYIANPQVTVGVNEINSRRVYVTGEVLKPGAFPLQPGMTVLQALAISGGFTQFARIKSIYILRTEDGKQVRHEFNYKDVVKGKKPELNILVQPDDVIVVP
jgi:polysaccharide biosynthesis/export protein